MNRAIRCILPVFLCSVLVAGAGVLLARYAAELKAAGLKRITVSLDSLDPEVFARMSGGFGGLIGSMGQPIPGYGRPAAA